MTEVYGVLPAPHRDPLQPVDWETGWKAEDDITLPVKPLQSHQPPVLLKQV